MKAKTAMTGLAAPKRGGIGARATVMALAVTAGLAGCGKEANFAGGSNAKGKSGDLKGPNNGLPPAGLFSALTWHWACEKTGEAGLKDPVIDGDKIDIFGGGDHAVPRKAVDNVPLTFKGELCKPEEMVRDIVFVIDVSGSMRSNDPYNLLTKSCGRLDAVRRVMTAYKDTSTRFSIVTFESAMRVQSTAYFATEAELIANAAPGAKPEDVLCAQLGGTNYDAGLQAAAGLLAKGRDHATKEVYFLSDGEPDLGKDGAALAKALKTQGVSIGGNKNDVTIATIMLGAGDDTVLRTQIASTTIDKLPLHERVENASKLAEILAKLADNEIVAASINLRPIDGDGEWTSIDIMPHQTNLEFELPSHLVDAATNPAGLEVMYRYVEASGKETQSTGRLVWKAN